MIWMVIFVGFKFLWILCALLIHKNYLYSQVIRVGMPQKYLSLLNCKILNP